MNWTNRKQQVALSLCLVWGLFSGGNATAQFMHSELLTPEILSRAEAIAQHDIHFTWYRPDGQGGYFDIDLSPGDAQWQSVYVNIDYFPHAGSLADKETYAMEKAPKGALFRELLQMATNYRFPELRPKRTDCGYVDDRCVSTAPAGPVHYPKGFGRVDEDFRTLDVSVGDKTRTKYDPKTNIPIEIVKYFYHLSASVRDPSHADTTKFFKMADLIESEFFQWPPADYNYHTARKGGRTIIEEHCPDEPGRHPNQGPGAMDTSCRRLPPTFPWTPPKNDPLAPPPDTKLAPARAK